MTNDHVLRFPWAWPNFGPGTDRRAAVKPPRSSHNPASMTSAYP